MGYILRTLKTGFLFLVKVITRYKLQTRFGRKNRLDNRKYEITINEKITLQLILRILWGEQRVFKYYKHPPLNIILKSLPHAKPVLISIRNVWISTNHYYLTLFHNFNRMKICLNAIIHTYESSCSFFILCLNYCIYQQYVSK